MAGSPGHPGGGQPGGGQPGGQPGGPGRAEISRRAILQAARELFSERGYAATSVADIVARAGTSVGLPYYHFGSKRQIFLTLWKEYQVAQEYTVGVALDRLRRRGVSGPQLLLAGSRAYLGGAWQARDILPMVHGCDTPSGFDAVMRQTDDRWLGRNRALLAGYDADLVRGATVLFNGGLRAVCREFPRCRDEAEAGRLSEDALLVFAGLLSGLRS